MIQQQVVINNQPFLLFPVLQILVHVHYCLFIYFKEFPNCIFVIVKKIRVTP